MEQPLEPPARPVVPTEGPNGVPSTGPLSRVVDSTPLYVIAASLLGTLAIAAFLIDNPFIGATIALPLAAALVWLSVARDRQRRPRRNPRRSGWRWMLVLLVAVITLAGIGATLAASQLDHPVWTVLVAVGVFTALLATIAADERSAGAPSRPGG